MEQSIIDNLFNSFDGLTIKLTIVLFNHYSK